MWRSNITREHLLQKISLLAMLGPIRDKLKIYTLKEIDGIGRSLMIEQEGEIDDNLAFLSYRRKNCRNITALCMQEDGDGEGMLVRLAVNGDELSHIKNGLQKICTALEGVAQRNNPESDDKSHAVKLHGELRQFSLTHIEPTGLAALQEKSDTFLDLFRTLKFAKSPQSQSIRLDIMKQLLKLAHELGQSRNLAIAQGQSSLGTVEKDALLDWLRKLGQYYKASCKLVLIAKRKLEIISTDPG
ncbi:hypothetical protein ACJ73_02827 [Blastomyces percursus]|uniref:Uncharacterized protein n=1 Tax=Blastomyces percursus TaxID=1658174 RepID=A0A1J9QCI3_9EURO|nr:hypothetical protein ACJ73_02827 [Blastomyces percursus]